MTELLDLGLAFADAGLVVLLTDLAFALTAAAFAATFTEDKYPVHKRTRRTCLLGLSLRTGCLLSSWLLHSGRLLGSCGSLLCRNDGFLRGSGFFYGLCSTGRCLLCRSGLRLLRRFLRRGTLLGGLGVLPTD